MTTQTQTVEIQKFVGPKELIRRLKQSKQVAEEMMRNFRKCIQFESDTKTNKTFCDSNEDLYLVNNK